MNWLGWQIDYLLLLQNFRDITGGMFDRFFLSITWFGEIYIPLIFICIMYWCVNKKSGLFIFWSYLFGFVINTVMKVTACIYRPWMLSNAVQPVTEAVPAATGYSFPSGHTAGCVSIWGGASMVFWNNKIVRYLCFLIVFFVMLSRNYLGVHTPQDVIVSLLVGIVILIYTHKLIEWEENGNNRDLIIVSVVTILNILFALYVALKSYPMDYVNGELIYNPSDMKYEVCARTGFVFGAFWGWLIEKRFVGFDAKTGNILQKIGRFIIGIASLILLYKFLQPILVNNFGHLYGLFTTYICINLYVTLIYPFLIKQTYLYKTSK